MPQTVLLRPELSPALKSQSALAGGIIGVVPYFTKANPTLLACGTYYVAERELQCDPAQLAPAPITF